MRFIVYLIIIFLAIIFQHTLLPALSVDFLNLPLILVLLFVIFFDYYQAISLSFLMGIFYDFFSAGPFGLNILSFVILSFLLKQIIQKFRRVNLAAIAIIGILGLAGYYIVFFIVNSLFNFLNLRYIPKLADLIFTKKFLLSIVANATLFILNYFVVKKLRK